MRHNYRRVLTSAGCTVAIAISSPSAQRIPGEGTPQLLATLSLETEIAGLAGRELRGRLITINPHTTASVHSHKDRPALLYVVQGKLLEHRGDKTVSHTAGHALTIGWIPHTLENPTGDVTRYLEVDIFKAR